MNRYTSGIFTKMVGLAIGIPFLATLNLARLVHLYHLGVHDRASFDFAHGVVWEIVMVLAVVTVWLSWKTWSQTDPVESVAPAQTSQ